MSVWPRRHCRRTAFESIVRPEIGRRSAGFIDLTVDNTKDVFPVARKVSILRDLPSVTCAARLMKVRLRVYRLFHGTVFDAWL